LIPYFQAIKSPTASRNLSEAWTVGEGFYIWGAQLEELPFVSSYIRTEDSAVTRAADDLGLPVAGSYNQNNMTYHIIGDWGSLPTGGVSADRSIVRIDGLSGEVNTKINAVGSLTQNYGTATKLIVSDQGFNAKSSLSVTYAGGSSFEFFIDGEIASLETSIGSFTIDLSETIDLGSSEGDSYLFGHIQKVIIYDTVLTAREVSLL